MSRTSRYKGGSVKRTFAVLLMFVCLGLSAGEPPKNFELAEGERVAFVGNTFTERDQYSGYFETLLSIRFHSRNLIFRNLGWSGDTVWGHARSGFGTPQDGFNLLSKHIAELKPTTIFVCYGMSESFEGESGLSSYLQQLDKMLDALAKSGARLVMVSPIKHENLGAPLPNPAEHNTNLRLYIDAMKKVAATRGYAFVDMFELLGEGDAKARFTDNGIHLTPYGYWKAALALERGLALSTTSLDLSPLAFPKTPVVELAEKLRAAINAKNEHYFNRWRPQNDTYIYGFRKHEQGKNAALIPNFDPLITEKEIEIAKMRTDVAKLVGGGK